jgi:Outer membrane protein beta-barrel domain
LSKSASRLAQLFALSAIIVAATAGNAAAQTSPDRGGFTLLVNLGVGIQNDTGIEESAVGLAGLNLGVGWFIKPNVAILGRFSGTNASYETDFGDFRQVSGVLGPTLQYWASDKVYLEGGAGLGRWSADDESDSGFGLILGAGFTLWNRGKHNLQVGVEYAPVFTDGAVHNFGFTFGYQLF